MFKSGLKYQFGGKLREVRERKGITMRDVAGQAGVSESLISQIERNKVSPSIDTLLTIIDVLEIDMEYLFKDYHKDKQVRIVKREERKSIRIPGVSYQQLSVMSDPGEEHALEAFLLAIEPGYEKGSEEYGHAGRELGFLIRGRGEFHFGNRVHQLEEGDSITFASDVPHVLKNTGEEVLEALWIITPPKMLFFRK